MSKFQSNFQHSQPMYKDKNLTWFFRDEFMNEVFQQFVDNKIIDETPFKGFGVQLENGLYNYESDDFIIILRSCTQPIINIVLKVSPEFFDDDEEYKGVQIHQGNISPDYIKFM